MGDLYASVNNLFEPFKFLNQKGLLVARTLVNNPDKILFSVVNISDKTVRINKHTTVASVQQVDIVEHDKSLSDLVSSELPEHLQSLFDRSCERLSEKRNLSS